MEIYEYDFQGGVRITTRRVESGENFLPYPAFSERRTHDGVRRVYGLYNDFLVFEEGRGRVVSAHEAKRLTSA
jgi:hypothetical protein